MYGSLILTTQSVKQAAYMHAMCVQWNPSIAVTVGEWQFGCYTKVAVVEGFRVLGVLVHEKF